VKIIYRYLYLEILTVGATTVGVLTCFLVLMNVFKDVLDLLLNSDISLWIIAKMVLLLVPFVLTFTLPWGLLLAVLLVFGRMSHDNEILALKSSGQGLAPVIAPAIWIALVASGFSFWINAYLGPRCRDEFKKVGYELISTNPMAFFASEKTIDRFAGYRIYIGRKQGRQLEDIYVWQTDEKMTPVLSIRARTAEVQPDIDNERIILMLRDAIIDRHDPKNPEDVSKVQPAVGQMKEYPMEVSLASIMSRFTTRKSPGSSTLEEVRQQILNPTDLPAGSNITPWLTELQKRLSFSLSCFTFVLVAIPLAIQTNRRETSVGLGLSLAIVLAYYCVVVLALALKKNPRVYPEIIIWLPNFVFEALGVFLIWRVNKR
jgi:lipopolysaccharide export system permease protein